MKGRILGVMCLLGACTDLPDLGRPVGEAALNAPAPRLVPLESILGEADRLAVQSETIAIDPGRIAQLQARADRLRGPIIDRATRTRMIRGIAASP